MHELRKGLNQWQSARHVRSWVHRDGSWDLLYGNTYLTSGNMLWYDRCIHRGKELIGTRMDLPGRALIGSRTGSSGQCEADPDRLRSDIKLNFGYVVEDINKHLIQKESPHLVG
jgi:hypothetical protein